LQLQPGAFRTAFDIAVAQFVGGVEVGDFLIGNDRFRDGLEGFGVTGYVGGDVGTGPSGQATRRLPLVVG